MTLKHSFWLSLIVTLLLGGAFSWLDPMIRGAASPNGIVSLELCAYSDGCGAILSSWDSRQETLAAFLLGIDYLFLIVYALAIFAALRLSAAKLGGRLGQLTRQIAWLAPLAGFCDVVENTFLISGLLSGDYTQTGWPAALFASAKFAALGLAFAWFLLVLPVGRWLLNNKPQNAH